MSTPPAFDRFQFENKRNRAVSQESRLSFSDYTRMRTERRSTTRAFPLPSWVLNDDMLRQVIKLRAWQYVHGSFPMPADLSIEALEKMVEAHSEKLKTGWGSTELSGKQADMRDHHFETVAKNGNYLRRVTKLAWLYRLGWSSVDCANELGMRPQAVRVHWMRLNRVARKLFPEACLPRYEKKRNRAGQSKNSHPHLFINALKTRFERALESAAQQ